MSCPLCPFNNKQFVAAVGSYEGRNKKVKISDTFFSPQTYKEKKKKRGRALGYYKLTAQMLVQNRVVGKAK